MRLRLRRFSLLLVVASAGAQDIAPVVTLAAGADGAVVAVGGDTFLAMLESRFGRPIVWPLRAPGGVPVTRSWPMAEEPDAERDHPHQKSSWFAHGDVNGVDFWTEGERAGRVELDGRPRSTLDEAGHVQVMSRHRWVDADGRIICRDERTLHAYVETESERVLDLAVTLQALPDEPLRLGDTKEGTMALRLHPSLRLEGKVATGRYLDSEGRKDREVWGQRARWVACGGTVDGHRVGVVLMDHPRNLRHPTWWHARPYGLLAANPFGAHDFAGARKGSGDHEVAAGGELPLRYRIWLFAGELDATRIEAVWHEFAGVKVERAGK